MFQSPRSGKFVSDLNNKISPIVKAKNEFQSPRSGKFVSDFSSWANKSISMKVSIPQIGEICIRLKEFKLEFYSLDCFNPLDRGNLYQINLAARLCGGQVVFQSPRSGKFVSDFVRRVGKELVYAICFNPLDRGNLYQIALMGFFAQLPERAFQSPRSGKFVSDLV